MLDKQDIKKAFQFAGFWTGAIVVVFMGMVALSIGTVAVFRMAGPDHADLSGWGVILKVALSGAMLIMSLALGYILTRLSKYSGLG